MAVKRLLCSFLLIASPLLTSSFAGGFGAPVIRRQQQRYQHQHQQHRRHLQPLRMMSDWGLPPPPPPKSSLLGLGKAVLGVDYGTRRVGVGVSAGLVPRPLTVLKHGGNDTAVGLQLLRLARGEMADLIVVGMPFDKDGTETFQAQLTRDFARLLASLSGERRGGGGGRGGPRVVLVDERYSSAEAAARMQHVSRKADVLARLDAESACVILEAFFNDGGEDGATHEAVPPEPAFLAEVRRKDEARRRREKLEATLAAENEASAAAAAARAAAAEDALADAYRIDPTFDVASLDIDAEIARLAEELDNK